MKRMLVFALIGAILLAGNGTGGLQAQPRLLNDEEMDGVSGGDFSPLQFSETGVSPTSAHALSPTEVFLTDNSVQSIYVGEQAQQNLTSLVNILAINSAIQVMLNVNVTINSSVNTITQGNQGIQNGLP